MSITDELECHNLLGRTKCIMKRKEVMHDESYWEMQRNLKKFLDEKTKYIIVDIGAMNIGKGGTYRSFIKKEWKYIGIDVVNGPSVDIVVEPFSYPFKSSSVDVIISGQCFEHSTNPFKLMKELARICKPKGYLFMVAPFIWAEHRHPIDCFRFLPDGWKALFDENNIECIDSYFKKVISSKLHQKTGIRYSVDKGYMDCWAIGRKKFEHKRGK